MGQHIAQSSVENRKFFVQRRKGCFFSAAEHFKCTDSVSEISLCKILAYTWFQVASFYGWLEWNSLAAQGSMMWPYESMANRFVLNSFLKLSHSKSICSISFWNQFRLPTCVSVCTLCLLLPNVINTSKAIS